MNREEIHNGIRNIREGAESILVNEIEDSAGTYGNWFASDIADVVVDVEGTPTNPAEYYDWLHKADSAMDYLVDGFVSSIDWADNLSDFEKFELIDNHRTPIDEYISEVDFKPQSGETFTEMIIRAVEWYVNDRIRWAAMNAVEPIRRLIAIAIDELEETYGDETTGIVPGSVTYGRS